jgi:hypothetical protein
MTDRVHHLNVGEHVEVLRDFDGATGLRGCIIFIGNEWIDNRSGVPRVRQFIGVKLDNGHQRVIETCDLRLM